MQCSLYIRHHPEQFLCERNRVDFVISHLTGRARAWETSLWRANDATLELEATFHTHFCHFVIFVV